MSTPRVVISVVNNQGLGVFEDDAKVEPVPLPAATLHRFYSAPKVPLTGIKYVPLHEMEDIANKEGAEFLQCEMAAGAKSPMHATPSVDFGVMISGEIVLILDSGEEKTLRAGDIYIQKATSHCWENRSAEPARFCTVLLASRS